MKWSQLKYWSTGEWQVVDERLKELTKKGVAWCPGRTNLFAAHKAVAFDDVKVVICGQDPYPNPNFATGMAFSIPRQCETYPASLAIIIDELRTDVDNCTVLCGDLTHWCQQGVLLWNAIPSCNAWESKSHHWEEWEPLTAEMFKLLSSKNIVFAFFGSTAQYYSKYVDQGKSVVLNTSHPSPRGAHKTASPFRGSRIFSTINLHLSEMGHKTIDWRVL